MQVVAESPGERCFLPQPESSGWFLEVGRQPGSTWRNRFTLVGSEAGWDPGVCTPFVAPRALLMVVASEDRLAPTELSLAAFERAREPKRLEVIAGDHFVPYSGAGFELASKAMREFLLERLD